MQIYDFISILANLSAFVRFFFESHDESDTPPLLRHKWVMCAICVLYVCDISPILSNSTHIAHI